MKKFLLSLSLVSLSAAAGVAQSSTASTPPVGFITITVNGATGSTPGYTLISPTLTNPVLFQGVIASVSGSTITITGATTFTAGQYSTTSGAPYNEPQYYAEIFSASQAGVISDITGTTAYNSTTNTATITTAQNLSSMITAGESIAIRQHMTLNSFFGANNTYGLLGSTTGDPSTADNVLVWNADQQTTFWYYNGTSPGFSDKGWYDGSLNPAGSLTIAPFEGVLIARKGTGNVAITVMGSVKEGNTLFPVATGPNYLGTVSAQGLTLATSGLISSGLKGSSSGDPSQSDQVSVYNASGQLKTYFYYNGTSPSFSDAGWYDSGLAPVGTLPLTPGVGLIVNRTQGAAFNWTVPVPSSF